MLTNLARGKIRASSTMWALCNHLPSIYVALITPLQAVAPGEGKETTSTSTSPVAGLGKPPGRSLSLDAYHLLHTGTQQPGPLMTVLQFSNPWNVCVHRRDLETCQQRVGLAEDFAGTSATSTDLPRSSPLRRRLSSVRCCHSQQKQMLHIGAGQGYAMTPRFHPQECTKPPATTLGILLPWTLATGCREPNAVEPHQQQARLLQLNPDSP